MKEPNFFIIGAPKCGTTSLASWLARHPNVFISPVKEPHYFDYDFPRREWNSPEQYYSLFRSASQEHKAIGEASVYYLWSRVAVPEIEKELPRSKYIVMLRNPVDMAPSLHGQNIYIGDEDEDEFSEAWALQAERKKGKKLPRDCRDPKLVQYEEGCRIGEQLLRLYETADRGRVLTVFLEDVQQDVHREWARILAFLGISYWDDVEFRAENPAKHWRWAWVRDLQRLYGQTRRRLNLPPLGWGVFEGLQRLSVKDTAREPLSDELRRELVDTFSDDIDLLAELTGRDLSHWKTV